jgi:hypothetical protein
MDTQIYLVTLGYVCIDGTEQNKAEWNIMENNFRSIVWIFSDGMEKHYHSIVWKVNGME